MTDVTRILSEIERGDPAASEQLLPLVYDELRKLAAASLANEKPGQTLQATALVHEAYVRLVGGESEKTWDSRGHFFAAAAESMRRILVDQAREKQALKRGGGRLRRVDFDDAVTIQQEPDRCDQLLALDIALDRLQQQDAIKAELVKLRYFAGLTGAQAAEALGIGVSTADKYWAYAKVWLRSEMQRIDGDSG
jgi:RNA polymerase sigma factor (TIGR02999 family)